jgi:DNA-binding XRE family transcriptional regulator
MKKPTAIFNPLPLIQARDTMGLTQVQLARGIGCTQSTIAGIENRKKKPSVEMLAKLCYFLNVRMDCLFFFENFNDNTDIRLTKYRQ